MVGIVCENHFLNYAPHLIPIKNVYSMAESNVYNFSKMSSMLGIYIFLTMKHLFRS
jgi:hypothetical protein